MTEQHAADLADTFAARLLLKQARENLERAAVYRARFGDRERTALEQIKEIVEDMLK